MCVSDVADRFDADTQRRLFAAVWSMCQQLVSKPPVAESATNWPGQVYEYHRRTSASDPRRLSLRTTVCDRIAS